MTLSGPPILQENPMLTVNSYASLWTALLAGSLLFAEVEVGYAQPTADGEAAKAVAKTPLIPRTVLFGNPDKAGAKISPDGKHLSYLAPVDDVLNVWVAPVDDLAVAKPVTHDKTRGIRLYFWAHSNKDI